MAGQPLSYSGRVEVVYRLACEPTDAEALARKIAYEQTVELPEAQVTDAAILENVVGRVDQLEVGEHCSLATISYNPALCLGNFSQLLILLFGNVSLFPGVRIVDLRLPGSLLSSFSGPQFGIDGLRSMLGVYGRPLLATAIKPRGLSVEAMASLAAGFARGGGDIVKDDQNLADDLETFKQRTEACQRAVESANREAGRGCVYFPHIGVSADDLEAAFAHVQAIGAKGVLLCPLVLGMDLCRSLCRRHNLVLMAHPALSGSYTNSETQGIAHDILLGTLFRIAGADISVFPHFGGRFSFSRQQCTDIHQRLVEPLAGLNSSFPGPAGGMQYDRLQELHEHYGDDSLLLLGGALQARHPDIEQGTRDFLNQIRGFTHERLEPPSSDFVSACEVGQVARQAIRDLLVFNPDYHWSDRQAIDYKQDGSIPFEGVSRVELVGQQGEKTAFDLRYFELQPGGFTSLEKHQHTHVVIGARGQGIVVNAQQRQILNMLDIAYIAPMQVHQLRNETDQAFGFFCIVDHERDRPQSPDQA